MADESTERKATLYLAESAKEVARECAHIGLMLDGEKSKLAHQAEKLADIVAALARAVARIEPAEAPTPIVGNPWGPWP